MNRITTRQKCRRLILLILAGICLWLGLADACAAEQTALSILDKRLTVFAGIRFYQAEGDFSSTRQGRPEISLDLDDLGFDDNSISPIAGAMIRFGKRWNLRLDYFGYHEEGNRVADFRFNFEDLEAPVGARIDSSIDLDLYVANLSYDLISSERARFGLGIGVHTATIELDISAKVSVDGSEVFFGEAEEDFLAPLPNIYASGAYSITDNFILRYGGGWMGLSYNDYDGSLYFADLFFEYWIWKNFGSGVGYRYLMVDVTYNSGKKKEEYDVRIPGPVIYLTFAF